MSHRDKRLMQYLDGELAEPARREVEEELARCPEARATLAAYVDTGDALRRRTQQVVAAQPFVGFAERTLRRAVAAPPASRLERLLLGLRRWLRPAALWPAAAAATVAVVALLVVGLRGWAGQANTCTIESVEYGGSAAAIFMIPDEHGKGHTTVIWAHPPDDTEADEAP